MTFMCSDLGIIVLRTEAQDRSTIKGVVALGVFLLLGLHLLSPVRVCDRPCLFGR